MTTRDRVIPDSDDDSDALSAFLPSDSPAASPRPTSATLSTSATQANPDSSASFAVPASVKMQLQGNEDSGSKEHSLDGGDEGLMLGTGSTGNFPLPPRPTCPTTPPLLALPN